MTEAQIRERMECLQDLLSDWPTMRALSAYGAEKATANKAEARKIVAEVLAGLGEG